jgi:hypothetical protein
MEKKRELGQYYTVLDVFRHRRFKKWLRPMMTWRVLDPFAGAGNLAKMLPALDWALFDIEPTDPTVLLRDSFHQFPTGYNLIITNPPYGAKNAFSARGLVFPASEYCDIYQHALGLCLGAAGYVAAILPAAFLKSGLFRERLVAVINLPCSVFAETETPVCLALFSPEGAASPALWDGDQYIGRLSDLAQHLVLAIPACLLTLRFNAPTGEIGVNCLDSRSGQSIAFIPGSAIDPARVKKSSRHRIRILLPVEWPPGAQTAILVAANDILRDYRHRTADVFLTPSRGLRADGHFRRRIDYETIARILTLAATQLGLPLT